MSTSQDPEVLKEKALVRLSPPHKWSVRQVGEEIGVCYTRVWKWRKQFEKEGLLVKKEKALADAEWSADQIFAFVLETATLSEHELAEYCREKGLYVEQIKLWKKSCIEANQPQSGKFNQLANDTRNDRKRIRLLEKELKRKDKALAETAALLVLREKYNALWEEDEDE